MRIHVSEIDRHGTFRVTLDGETIVRQTTTPLCSAARALRARGIDPETVLEKVVNGQATMTTTIGHAAALTVQEGNNRPRFVKFKPFGGVPA